MQWHCADDGKAYRILELDWHFSLAMGFRMVRLEEWMRRVRRLARMIGKLAGLEMVCSHRHL